MEQFEHLEETQLSSEAKYDGTLLHIRARHGASAEWADGHARI